MNMRPVHDRRVGACDPYDHNRHTPLIDKMIGNAYEVVRYVARHIPMIQYITANMETLHTVAGSVQSYRIVPGIAGAVGEITSIPLPPDITISQVLDSRVCLVGTNGDLYPAESGHFTSVVQGGYLRLRILPTAPAGLAGMMVRWVITHEVE